MTYLALLNHLSNQQAPEPEPVMMEDEPMVVEDAEEEAVEAEEMNLTSCPITTGISWNSFKKIISGGRQTNTTFITSTLKKQWHNDTSEHYY